MARGKQTVPALLEPGFVSCFSRSHTSSSDEPGQEFNHSPPPHPHPNSLGYNGAFALGQKQNLFNLLPSSFLSQLILISKWLHGHFCPFLSRSTSSTCPNSFSFFFLDNSFFFLAMKVGWLCVSVENKGSGELLRKLGEHSPSLSFFSSHQILLPLCLSIREWVQKSTQQSRLKVFDRDDRDHLFS